MDSMITFDSDFKKKFKEFCLPSGVSMKELATKIIEIYMECVPQIPGKTYDRAALEEIFSNEKFNFSLLSERIFNLQNIELNEKNYEATKNLVDKIYNINEKF